MATQHQSLNISKRKRKEHKQDTCITKHKQGACANNILLV